MKIHLQEVSDNERCLFDCIRIKQNRLTKGILKKCVKHLSLKSTKGMHDATKKLFFSTTLEHVQRRATKFILRTDSSYLERLVKLKLLPLEYIREILVFSLNALKVI